MKPPLLPLLLLGWAGLMACQSPAEPKPFPYRGWNILSSHRENGLKTLDRAVQYDVNHIELSHYQLCHDLKDLRQPENRAATNFFIEAAHERGIEEVFVWDHAFYELDYYPDRFKVRTQGEEDFAHHTTKFAGGLRQQLNLDDPAFWRWVYADYDSLLALAPGLDGIVLTFIETGSYVIYQHSERMPSKAQKLAALVDSLAGHFIDRHGLELTIRTFIYNQFERDIILDALQRIEREDLTVMLKMTPHDWFLTYPYQDYVAELPFPVVIEYDAGMEYAGENLIANTFAGYFAEAFRHYARYPNVVGYCARTDRFEETAAVGTPGELNLYVLSRLAQDTSLQAEALTAEFIRQTYGAAALPHLHPAFDSAFSFILASMYTLGTHTANHSRLNFHRPTIYQSHTTGEWYPPSEQMRWVGHGVNRWFHNYRDVIDALSFPAYKTDTAGMRKDLSWVLDSGWLHSEERMTPEMLTHIFTEKAYAVELAEQMLAQVEKALPHLTDSAAAARLYQTFQRSVIFARERRGAAQAVYGYRLWSRGPAYQTSALQGQIYAGLAETEAMLDRIDTYPVHAPLGQWRWTRDREAFDLYQRVITETGWEAVGLGGVVVPKPGRP